MSTLKIGSNRKKKLQKFQRETGYLFNDETILNQALLHRSYANEFKRDKVYDNERLEFLGDSVLGLVVSNHLFNEYRELTEGELSKYRANLVCEESLSKIAVSLELGEYLLLGKGEEANGGRQRPSILADALEAFIGGVYLDGGMAAVQRFIILRFFNEDTFEQGEVAKKDFKTTFQEMIQKLGYGEIEYRIIREWGPDHDKNFEVEIKVGSRTFEKGAGKTKKEAEQQAANNSIQKIKQG